MAAQPEIRYSACPHDCPSTCALEVERLGDRLIGKVRGARENTYTAGVICSKVARYAERIHHPDRLTTPLRRVGDKGSRESFAPVSWDDALDITAESLLKAEQRHGSQTVWPYYYAGTMGLVMRDGINRLRHVKRLLRPAFHHLRDPRLERFHRRDGTARGQRSARDGEVRSRRHLGHQRGGDAGQRDDPTRWRRGAGATRRSWSSTPTATPPRSRRTCSCACVRERTARSPAR